MVNKLLQAEAARSFELATLTAVSGRRNAGHTFESCRVRQESMCRGCRDCGGQSSGSLGLYVLIRRREAQRAN